MKTYRTVGLSEEEFIKIIEKVTGKKVERIDYDKGIVNVVDDDNIDYDSMMDGLKKHFNEKYLYIFTEDGDQSLPDEIMIMFSDEKQPWW